MRPLQELRPRIHQCMFDDESGIRRSVSHELPLAEAPDAYQHFDRRDMGWSVEKRALQLAFELCV